MFVEIIVSTRDLRACGIESRDELEDSLDEALEEDDLGKIVGGGSGSGNVLIEVELTGDFDAGIKLLRKLLKRAGAPSTTQLRCHEPKNSTYSLE